MKRIFSNELTIIFVIFVAISLFGVNKVLASSYQTSWSSVRNSNECIHANSGCCLAFCDSFLVQIGFSATWQPTKQDGTVGLGKKGVDWSSVTLTSASFDDRGWLSINGSMLLDDVRGAQTPGTDITGYIADTETGKFGIAYTVWDVYGGSVGGSMVLTVTKPDAPIEITSLDPNHGIYKTTYPFTIKGKNFPDKSVGVDVISFHYNAIGGPTSDSFETRDAKIVDDTTITGNFIVPEYQPLSIPPGFYDATVLFKNESVGHTLKKAFNLTQSLLDLLISPTNLVINSGQQQQFKATVAYNTSLTADVTTTTVWSVVNDAGNNIGTITAMGLFRAVSDNKAVQHGKIKATYTENGQTLEASTPVTVNVVVPTPTPDPVPPVVIPEVLVKTGLPIAAFLLITLIIYTIVISYMYFRKKNKK